jgi:PKD repeat protein
VVGYSFAYGDGSTSPTTVTSSRSHTYDSAGNYVVTVTVTDNRGDTDTASATVSPTAVTSSIAFRASAGYSGKYRKSHTFTVPGAVHAGDQMVMFVTGSTAASLTVPGGWTQRGEAIDSNIRTVVLTRKATGADPGSSVPLLWSAGSRTMVSFAAYSGVGANAVTMAVETSAKSIAAHSTPAVTVPVNGAWVLSYWADKNASSTDWSAPGGQVVRAQPPVTVSSGTVRVSALLTDDGRAASAGPRAGLTATANGTANRATMVTVVLVPA